MPPPLAQLLGDIRACRICRDAPRFGAALAHEPRPIVAGLPSARILIVGQAPGTRAHASGIAYDDRSGERLRQWFGMTAAEFYDPARVAIVPMGFCFPGQDANGSDLPPRRECVAHWHDAVMAQLPQLSLVLAAGRHAQLYHLRRLGLDAHIRPTLTEMVTRWREIVAASDRPKVIPLPHPSWRNTGWLKQNPWFETELLPVLRAEVRGLLDAGRRRAAA